MAISTTTATRLLNEMPQGKQKKQAVTAALDRVELLATKRKEVVTDEIKAAINAKAESIWGGKK